MANNELYRTYQRQLETGRRKEAGLTIRSFIESFSGLPEKRQWTEAFLNSWKDSHKIRHELYEHVVFPALLESYQKAETWGIRWLARTINNLYQSDVLWQQIGRKSGYELLTELLAIDPLDEAVKQQLLRWRIEGLRYSVHEWPAGILYGNDGASLEECVEIEKELNEVRDFDASGVHSDFLADFEAKLRVYVRRLESNAALRAEAGSAGDTTS